MTYILAGKLNNRCFIMVDKVVDNNPNEPVTNKLFHPTSNPNIHLSLTGRDSLMKIIKKYDKELYDQNKQLEINDSTFDYLGKELEKYSPFNIINHFVYIINGDEVLRYDLIFEKKKYVGCSFISIKEGEFLYCTDIKTISMHPAATNASVRDFSEWYLKKVYTESSKKDDVKYDDVEYFKAGFDFYQTDSI